VGRAACNCFLEVAPNSPTLLWTPPSWTISRHTDSPSGAGLGPVGGGVSALPLPLYGAVSKFEDIGGGDGLENNCCGLGRVEGRRGIPRPARAQFTSFNTDLSSSATGETMFSAGKTQSWQTGQA